MSIFGSATKAKALIAGTLALSVILPIFSQKTSTTLLFLLIAFWAAIMAAWPFFGLFLAIIIRPCLDILSAETFITISDINLNLAAIFSLIMISLTAIIVYRKRLNLKNLPLSKSWLIFLLITFFSVAWSFDRMASLSEWLRLTSIFCLFILGWHFGQTEKAKKRLTAAIALSAIIPSIFAVYQYLTDTGLNVAFEGIYNRIYGTFAHPNLFAYYLVLAVSVTLLLIFKNKKTEIEKAPAALLAALLSLILILTFTRGAWLALAIVLFIVTALNFRKTMLFGILIGLIFYAVTPAIQSRVNDIILNPYSSIDWRRDLWSDSYRYAQERLILGQGAGVAKEFILKKRGPAFGSADPHNDYLKIFIENGLLGLAAYLVLAATLIFSLWRQYRNSEAASALQNLVLLSLAISFFTLSFFDNILRNTALEWSFWLLIGLSLANDKNKD